MNCSNLFMTFLILIYYFTMTRSWLVNVKLAWVLHNSAPTCFYVSPFEYAVFWQSLYPNDISLWSFLSGGLILIQLLLTYHINSTTDNFWCNFSSYFLIDFYWWIKIYVLQNMKWFKQCILSIDLQGVPKNCLHFCFLNFSASKAPGSSILDIFQQPFSCRF